MKNRIKAHIKGWNELKILVVLLLFTVWNVFGLIKVPEVCRDSTNTQQCLQACYDDIFAASPQSPGGAEVSRELFLIYFNAFQSMHTIESHFDEWMQVFSRFTTAYPDDELTSTLQLNLASALTSAGKTDSAIAVYQQVILQFDSRTRFGTEALFFIGQLFYQKQEYVKAIEAFSQIRTPIFLPVSKQELTTRIAECRFRLMENALAHKDTSKANQLISEILQKSLPPLFHDSILFHRSEIELGSDTISACLTLDTIIQQGRNHQIYQGALYNQLFYRCPLEGEDSTGIPLYQSRALAYIQTTAPSLRRLAVHDLMLWHVLTRQDTRQLEMYFKILPLVGLTLEIRSVTLHLLRNSANNSFQQSLIAHLNQILADTSHPWNPEVQSLSREISLYQQYFRYQSGKDIEYAADTLYPHAWEQSMLQLVRGVWFARQYQKTQTAKADIIDSVQTCLTKVSQANTELAFTAAQELLQFYLSLASEKVDHQKELYEKIGLWLVKLRFTIKAGGIIHKTTEWRRQLNSLSLHKTTLLTYKAIQSYLDQVHNTTQACWQKLAQLLADTETAPLEGKGEIAFELLIKKVQSIAGLQPKKSRAGILALISSGLAWYHMLPSGASQDLTGVQEQRLDHQARAGHFIIEILAGLEHYPDTSFLSKIGFLFQSCILPGDLTSCYTMRSAEGEIQCLPLTNQLPTAREALTKLRENSVPQNPSELQQYHKREHLANFFMLCENSKIRQLKTKLKKL